MERIHVFGILLFCFISLVKTEEKYKSRIPNGNIIPNPCSGGTWSAVGHMSPSGSGDINAFGHDFEKAGEKWTQAFCQMDSDGDGLSNGYELGDPDCVWSEGKTPSRTVAITNPAICEPWGRDPCGVNSTCVAKAGAGSRFNIASLPAMFTSIFVISFFYFIY